VLKRGFDIAVALAGLLIGWPVLLALALAVRLDSPGPAIHWSQRVGRDNRLFSMPKFRTMRTDTPDVATHLLDDPDRWITPLGRFLRRSSLDELPQLWSVLVLIDPPYERPDDYDRILETLGGLRARNPAAQALVWLPIKDLETLDSFLRDLEDELSGPVLVAEARVRPLDDPMKMNGCALALVGGPDLQAPFAAICGWVAQALGNGGGSRVYRLG
jgi:hypothetical protein